MHVDELIEAAEKHLNKAAGAFDIARMTVEVQFSIASSLLVIAKQMSKEVPQEIVEEKPKNAWKK